MGQRPARTPLHLSDSGQVTSWLVKVVIGFAVAGLLAFEGGAVMINRLTARDTASKAAQEAGFAWRDSGDYQRAETAARAQAESERTTLEKLEINVAARTSSATVRKRAKTLLIHNIGFLKKYTVTTATESAPFPS